MVSFHLKPLTIIFFVWFATSVVARRYVSVEFYRWSVGWAAEAALHWLTLLVAMALGLLPIIRPRFEEDRRWTNAALLFGLLVVAEIAWRLASPQAAWDQLKGFAIAVAVIQPGLLLLGIIVLLADRRAAGPPRAA
jgi:cytochrome b561